MRQRGMFVAGLGLVAVIALTVLGGAAMTGHAAVTQRVTAAPNCEPGTVTTGTTVGCRLTVTNQGSNTVHDVVVTVEVKNGGTLIPSSLELCTPNGTNTILTCNVGSLSGVGTLGSEFTETYEVQMPANGAAVTQTSSGRYAQKPNNRGSVLIQAVDDITQQLDDPDFDALYSDSETDSAQTAAGLGEDNPYSTGADLFGSFTVGLSVRERDVNPETSPNCPNGCYGAQEIDFDISPLSGTADPTSYTLTIEIADAAIPPGVQEDEIEVFHDLVQVPLCADADPAEEPCILSQDIATGNPKDATIVITGPGDQNGSWGVGGGF